MSLQVIHSPEPTPEVLVKSVFLAGPSPRKESDPNWRPQAIQALERAGFDGTVFAPLPRDGKWPENYLEQVAWEQRHINLADVVALWCPRDLEALLGFTTNVEFGELLSSGKLLYGRPDGAPRTRYLDARYTSINERQKEPFNAPSETLDALARQCVARLGDGSERRGGQRNVPLDVWRSRPFQAWHNDLVKAGNRLDDAKILWTFHIPQADNFLLCYSAKVKVWVARESRHKENEFIVSRTDISSICAYWPNSESHDVMDTKIVLVREFRSPARTTDGFLHDLPGGSSFSAAPESALQVAAEELEAETGIRIAPARFRSFANRQMAGAFGTHKSHLFAVKLTDEEIRGAEGLTGKSFGVASESEKTYVEVRTVGELLKDELLDHATVGMVMQVCLGRADP